jgi:hypothetical protein
LDLPVLSEFAFVGFEGLPECQSQDAL